MKRWLLLSGTLLGSVILTGCATVSELVDDPSVEHSVVKRPGSDETGHVLMTLREDNRLIRRTVTASGTLKICAETQADAISARSARSGLEVTGQGSVEDEITRRLTLTYARTQVSDVVRQLAWQLCNANLNGQIGNEFYQSSLRSLQDQAMAVLASEPKTEAAALDKMKALADQAEVAATADRELQKVIEHERTKRSEETTARAKIKACRSSAKNVEEYKTCMAG